MKDVIITVERQKKELKMVAICFVTAILLNVISIIVYNTAWKELYTQFLWLLIITAILYAASIVVRIILSLVKGTKSAR